MAYRDEKVYYWLRAAEELERGDRSTNPVIAAVHYDLAYRYGVLAAKHEGGASHLTFIGGVESISSGAAISPPDSHLKAHATDLGLNKKPARHRIASPDAEDRRPARPFTQREHLGAHQ